jgi:hypothetical protein
VGDATGKSTYPFKLLRPHELLLELGAFLFRSPLFAYVTNGVEKNAVPVSRQQLGNIDRGADPSMSEWIEDLFLDGPSRTHGFLEWTAGVRFVEPVHDSWAVMAEELGGALAQSRYRGPIDQEDTMLGIDEQDVERQGVDETLDDSEFGLFHALAAPIGP